MKDIFLYPTELDISELYELIDNDNILYYAKNSVILEAGDLINSLFFIVEGLIQVFFRNDRGNEMILYSQ